MQIDLDGIAFQSTVWDVKRAIANVLHGQDFFKPSDPKAWPINFKVVLEPGRGGIQNNKASSVHAKFICVPHADSTLYTVPAGVDKSALVVINDILPTTLDHGMVNWKAKPGASVTIVGSGLLAVAKLGATHLMESGTDAVKQVLEIRGGQGVDTDMEAVWYAVDVLHGAKI
ncbi:hypothetical protein A0H81_05046 [Grifola frondosa]|uniref:Uncharacterized protein n=1 Tax=Grifola frondosa TaxID=5627 RepID=A0A1C7MBM1_GRIFR|nr:hypothetical protein A0H81_05046 [Grifola frondosa]